MESHILPNELIGLSKNDYFDRILDNEKDFFFLIVYNDTEENGRTTTKIAKHLKHIADKNSFAGWNVYTINRSLFENIKKIIGKTKDSNIFAEDENPFPIEIYLKTPHSKDYIFLPFRPKKFFSEHSSKKMMRKMKKVEHLVEQINDEEDLNTKLVYSLNKLNTPTIIMRIDDSNKEHYRDKVKEYAKLAVKSLENKLLPFDSTFIVIKDKKLGNKLGLENDQLYTLRNDVVQAYERYSGKNIEDYRKYIEVDTQDFSSPVAFLQKYDNSEMSLFGNGNSEETEDEKRKRERFELRAFVNFVVPKVVLLRDMKRLHLGQLIRKCSQDKSKYVLSLYCPSTDPDRERKLEVFMEMYRRYKDKFIFCIIESEMLLELFPHTKSTLPCFVLFNFMNQIKDYPLFQNYYQSLVFPYEKYFLNSRSPNIPDMEEVLTSTEIILEGAGRVDYLNMEGENVQELKGIMCEETIDRLKRLRKDGLIQIYDNGSKSREWSLQMNKLSEDFNKRLRFYRIDNLNSSGFLPTIKTVPKYVYVSNKHLKMYVLDDFIAENEEKLRDFIKEVS